ncbi:thioesterase family protein [Mycolicibacterium pulveris]|uniref:Acyl-CoA thioesterase II n=1 Tax=Mycolicibacterium pulveris TaxID=36813 RepID=A0A7I7URC1_MYCPV|nr:acyl-CoA thioesterase domain-containing protein [Mycolicibacterium pulveris]MCV6982864.1 thioesterase family protein [Mycolicibacterium pulveris]BBY82726.1 acyl-CoA thioesterase II [Mycolicibacterium pulveris]
MPDLWRDLLACLDVTPSVAPPSQYGGVGYQGRNQQLNYHRVFGGQLLAQFVRIASLTYPDKAIKSQHAVFTSEGRADEPIAFLAKPHHEGRSFAALTITATQQHGVVVTSSISMHANETGPQHQEIESVPPVLGPEHDLKLDLIPWETRATVDLNTTATGPPSFEFWMRTPKTEAALAPALTAYATDLTLIGTALRPIEGVGQRGNGTDFTSAVTSHTVWFHRPFRTDDWLLLRQHSPLSAHGRSFGRGDVLTREGALVASYAQEALLRFPERHREGRSTKRRV